MSSDNLEKTTSRTSSAIQRGYDDTPHIFHYMLAQDDTLPLNADYILTPQEGNAFAEMSERGLVLKDPLYTMQIIYNLCLSRILNQGESLSIVMEHGNERVLLRTVTAQYEQDRIIQLSADIPTPPEGGLIILTTSLLSEMKLLSSDTYVTAVPLGYVEPVNELTYQAATQLPPIDITAGTPLNETIYITF